MNSAVDVRAIAVFSHSYLRLPLSFKKCYRITDKFMFFYCHVHKNYSEAVIGNVDLNRLCSNAGIHGNIL